MNCVEKRKRLVDGHLQDPPYHDTAHHDTPYQDPPREEPSSHVSRHVTPDFSRQAVRTVSEDGIEDGIEDSIEDGSEDGTDPTPRQGDGQTSVEVGGFGTERGDDNCCRSDRWAHHFGARRS